MNRGDADRNLGAGERMRDEEGVLIDWKRQDGQLGGMGLLNVVLSLILVSGRSVSDSEYSLRTGLELKVYLVPNLTPFFPIYRSTSHLSQTPGFKS